MADLERWVVGIMIAGIGLYGLVVSSRSHDSTMSFIGIAIFIASIIFNFYQIDKTYKEKKK